MEDDRKDPNLGEKLREVPIDWDALENAFENNAPEIHSYLQMVTGDVLRVVDGVADPQMHALIASDHRYLRIEPVSSREQYRWMEEYIPTLEDPKIRAQLTVAIDGKGAFRRFKDVLMSYGPERENWFAYRSEHLRTFMVAWLEAHSIKAISRPRWTPPTPVARTADGHTPQRLYPDHQEHRRSRNTDSLRRRLRDVSEKLGYRDLDTLLSFADFLRARRASRAHHLAHETFPASASPAEQSTASDNPANEPPPDAPKEEMSTDPTSSSESPPKTNVLP